MGTLRSTVTVISAHTPVISAVIYRNLMGKLRQITAEITGMCTDLTAKPVTDRYLRYFVGNPFDVDNFSVGTVFDEGYIIIIFWHTVNFEKATKLLSKYAFQESQNAALDLILLEYPVKFLATI